MSLLLTLLVTPVAYSLFDDLAADRRWRRLAGPLAAGRARIARVVRTSRARRRPAAERIDEPAAPVVERLAER